MKTHKNDSVITRVALVEQAIVNINDIFNRMDKRFDQMEKRFDQVDKRFERLEDSIDSRFDKVDRRLEHVDKKIDLKHDKLCNRIWFMAFFVFANTVGLAGLVARAFQWI